MKNFFLSLRYKWFRRWVTPIKFTGEIIYQLDRLSPIKRKNGYKYTANSITESQQAVWVDNQLFLKARKSFDTSDTHPWKIGWVELKDMDFPAYGTYIWNVRLARNSWCALWLLRKEYKQSGCGKTLITPEVDVMEILTAKPRIGHSVHWGCPPDKYIDHSKNTLAFIPEYNRDYEFAVKISPNKYEFFTDGIKTGEFKKGLSNKPFNVIMNNGVRKGTDPCYVDDFIINSFIVKK